jgi:hypothetical protein
MPRNALIQVRRDTAANWTSTNPTLDAGEIGFETDTGKLKVGTGSAAWNSLLYATDAGNITGGTLTIRTAATQDGVVIAGRAGGTGTYETTLTPTTLTADRTLTLPNATGTIALVGTAVSLIDSQTFTSSTTYTIPAGAKVIYYEAIAAGSGGAKGPGGLGAPGGCGGGFYFGVLDASSLGASITVTIGAGGTGATSIGGYGARGGDSRLGPRYFFGAQAISSTDSGYLPYDNCVSLTGSTQKGLGTCDITTTGKGYKGYMGGGGGGFGATVVSGSGYAGGSSESDPSLVFTLDQTLGKVTDLTSGGGGAGGVFTVPVSTGATGSAGGAKQGGGGGAYGNNVGGTGGAGGAPGGGGGGGGRGGSVSGNGGTGGRAEISVWVYG